MGKANMAVPWGFMNFYTLQSSRALLRSFYIMLYTVGGLTTSIHKGFPVLLINIWQLQIGRLYLSLFIRSGKYIVCDICGLRSPSFETPTNNASMQELVLQDHMH